LVFRRHDQHQVRRDHVEAQHARERRVQVHQITQYFLPGKNPPTLTFIFKELQDYIMNLGNIPIPYSSISFTVYNVNVLNTVLNIVFLNSSGRNISCWQSHLLLHRSSLQDRRDERRPAHLPRHPHAQALLSQALRVGR